MKCLKNQLAKMKVKKNNLFKLLNDKSEWVWRETLKVYQTAPETRVASSLSPIEIFVVLYYGGFLKFNSKDPQWEKRNRCIISKGHGSLCMYPILADLKFFDHKHLATVCSENTILGGIPDPMIPGYETINGSLGHGVGVATGIAIALREKKINRITYVVTGDGELHEGSNWEAFMFAAHHKLNKLVVIVDNNSISMLDKTKNVVDHIDLEKKFKVFGWEAVTIKEGHSVENIYNEIKRVENSKILSPKAIIVNTNKGNKVPGLEGFHLSHVTPINKYLLNKLLT
jgi:transketolase